VVVLTASGEGKLLRSGVGEQRSSYGTRSITAPLLPNTHVKQLREAIDHFIGAYNVKAAPFEWRKAEIKQQSMRDNIAYFCS
jgi:hypothetical protein